MTTEDLLLPAEGAVLLGVTAPNRGPLGPRNHLPYVRTPSGKYRFPAAVLHISSDGANRTEPRAALHRRTDPARLRPARRDS